MNKANECRNCIEYCAVCIGDVNRIYMVDLLKNKYCRTRRIGRYQESNFVIIICKISYVYFSLENRGSFISFLEYCIRRLSISIIHFLLLLFIFRHTKHALSQQEDEM